jgi:hypothetical protein
MFDYSVSISTDYFTIITGVYAEDDELAEKYAKEKILEYAGFDCDDLSHEITLEIMGRINA